MKYPLAAALALCAAIVCVSGVTSQPGKGPDGKGDKKGPPRPGAVLPPFARDRLDLTAKQEQQIEQLERTVAAQLRKILTPRQMVQLEQLLQRGPGGDKKGGDKKKQPPNADKTKGAAGGDKKDGDKKKQPREGDKKKGPPRRDPPMELGKPAPGTSPFHKNVKVTFTEKYVIVDSDGIPTHETGNFPNVDNPNRILKQDYRFYIPRQPVRAERTTPLPMGPIGVALNGIPFYNPYNAEGKNAVEGPFAEVFDSCCGHPDPLGRYHYHKYPACIHNPFKDKETPGQHSPLIGFAFDGYPIYGPNDAGGKPPSDLDECNGHSDPGRGYHYHVTSGFPYILGAYRGVAESANFPPAK